jgi:hypothetical protein
MRLKGSLYKVAVRPSHPILTGLWACLKDAEESEGPLPHDRRKLCRCPVIERTVRSMIIVVAAPAIEFLPRIETFNKRLRDECLNGLIAVDPVCDSHQPASAVLAQLVRLPNSSHKIAARCGLQAFLTVLSAECVCPR